MMTSRIFAAGIVVLGVGTMTAPVATSAGSGAPLAAPSSVAPSLVRPSFAGPLPAHGLSAFPAHMRGFRIPERGDRRGAAFPLWGGYASSVPSYYPSGYAAPYAEPVYIYPPTENFSERSRPIMTRPPECRTDTQKVPSEAGGERTINITRCY
jgi:hypothetical protein